MDIFSNSKMRQDNRLEWNRVLGYPLLSGYLEQSLERVSCPEEISDLFDKALWVNLNGGNLSDNFTISEAFKLDVWASNNKRPSIPESLVKQFREEWGLEFFA